MGGFFVKRMVCWVLLVCLMTGCTAAPVMETVADEMVMAENSPRRVLVTLPEDTVLPVMETDTGKLYICQDFEVSVQTLPGGDLNATVQTLCGFSADQVELLETAAGRYEFIWSSAGELGDQVGRAVILRDGNYHYCVAAMAPADRAQDCRSAWDTLFASVALS